MFARKIDPFIDLTSRPDNEMIALPYGPGKDKKPEPKGPSLSIYSEPIELPLTEKDLDTVISAEVKLKPYMIKKTVENGKTKYSYEIEVMAIRFTS